MIFGLAANANKNIPKCIQNSVTWWSKLKKIQPELNWKLCALCSSVKHVAYSTINYLKNLWKNYQRKRSSFHYKINCTSLCILNLNCKFVQRRRRRRRLFMCSLPYFFFVCSLTRVLHNYSFYTKPDRDGILWFKYV